MSCQATPSCYGAASSASRLFEVTPSGTWNGPCACAGIRNEHIPASGRMVSWKGGVAASGSIPGSDTHTVTGDSGGGGARPQVLGSLNCRPCTLICYIGIVLFIWYITLEWCVFDLLYIMFVLPHFIIIIKFSKLLCVCLWVEPYSH